MGLPIHLALVAELDEVSISDLTRVSAALQNQVTRDFSPIWNVEATVDPFKNLDDVPLGYWPVMVETDIQTPGAAGIHENRDDGQPFALVQYSDSWSLTASHEVLEMLADPSGDRLFANPSPDPKDGKTPVQILVEVCDPPEDGRFAYEINGILVSDFYTPRFFDRTKSSAVRYSFTDAIKEPRQVLKGDISWHNPVNNRWSQLQFFGSEPVVKDLGVLSGTGNLRSQIDALTIHPELVSGLKPKHKQLMAALAIQKAAVKPANARAQSLRSQIAALKQK